MGSATPFKGVSPCPVGDTPPISPQRLSPAAHPYPFQYRSILPACTFSKRFHSYSGPIKLSTGVAHLRGMKRAVPKKACLRGLKPDVFSIIYGTTKVVP